MQHQGQNDRHQATKLEPRKHPYQHAAAEVEIVFGGAPANQILVDASKRLVDHCRSRPVANLRIGGVAVACLGTNTTTILAVFTADTSESVACVLRAE